MNVHNKFAFSRKTKIKKLLSYFSIILAQRVVSIKVYGNVLIVLSLD